MSNSFHFQKFSIYQNNAAFKVGTDSVILGCWAPNYGKSILDVGTGTGLLSLILAQRFPLSEISAIEIDRLSFLDAKMNFDNSLFSKQISLINADIKTHKFESLFDTIITNPPYFRNDLHNSEQRKTNARHQTTLSFLDLIFIIKNTLHDYGHFITILPSMEFDILRNELYQNQFFINHELQISSYINSEIIRTAGVFSKSTKNHQVEKQYIYNADQSRSDWYTQLTKDFYLKK